MFVGPTPLLHLLCFFHSLSGYQGYISGVASENCFGERYTETSSKSANKTISRGIDQRPSEKWITTSKSQYKHHNANEHPNVSQTLNINRPEDRYVKVSETGD